MIVEHNSKMRPCREKEERQNTNLDEPSLETLVMYSGYIPLAQAREYHGTSIGTFTVVTHPTVTPRGIQILQANEKAG